jgi:hypothetical protein
MWSTGNLDTWSDGGWGVFIALNHQTTVGAGCCRWAHRTVRCATGHCLVRQPRHPTVRVLEHLTVGGFVLLLAPDSPVPHRTCTVHCPVHLWLLRSDSARTVLHCSLSQRLLQSTVAQSIRCFAGAPDSPVNYSGVRLEKPESDEFSSVRPWCTGHCPVRQTRAYSVSLLLWIWSLTWLFIGLYWTLMHQ